jgi:hypothetical protein
MFAAVHESLIGTKQKCPGGLTMSAVEVRADLARSRTEASFLPAPNITDVLI